MASSSLFSKYTAIRRRTMALIDPLLDEDCCVQSMPEASPVKWHLGMCPGFSKISCCGITKNRSGPSTRHS